VAIRLSGMIICLVLSYQVLECQNAVADLKTTGVPRYDVAVEKAVSFLQTMSPPEEQETSLVAYALLKAGVDLTDPRLAAGVADAVRRGTETRYDAYRGLYLAAVDAMLLVDVDKEKYRGILQQIANLLLSNQRPDGAWNGLYDTSRADHADKPADNSLTQYAVLGLWAAVRAGCKVPPKTFDKVASYLVTHSNPDGGWTYRITDASGRGSGKWSTDTMTIAAVGSLGVAKSLLFSSSTEQSTPKFGVLERAVEKSKNNGFLNYAPGIREAEIDASVAGGLALLKSSVRQAVHRQYFYYTLERAAALVGLQDDWYTHYGDVLLSTQRLDGSFDGALDYGPAVGTSFAVLYFMRSTQQILDYGLGIQVGGRDVQSLFDGKREKTELGPLDSLLKAMEGQDFASLDVSTDDLVQKIQFSSRDELVGEADKLRTLLKSPDPTNRQVAYWALGRTCEFDLIPLMLDGLKDPSIDVNVEALAALRYISRKPKGFGLSFDPLESLPESAAEEDRIKAANDWRTKAIKTWQTWYAGVRPYESGDGLDEFSR